MLAWPSKGTKGGSFIGYSPSGLPLYSFTGDAISKTSHSVAIILKNGLKQIYEESDSRRIFYFLCINLVSLTCWIVNHRFYCLLALNFNMNIMDGNSLDIHAPFLNAKQTKKKNTQKKRVSHIL